MGNSIEGARSVLEGMRKQREELDAAIAVMSLLESLIIKMRSAHQFTLET